MQGLNACGEGNTSAAVRHSQLQSLLRKATGAPSPWIFSQEHCIPVLPRPSRTFLYLFVCYRERNVCKRWHHWKGAVGKGRAWPFPGHLPILFQATDHTTLEQSLRNQVPVQWQTLIPRWTTVKAVCRAAEDLPIPQVEEPRWGTTQL